MASALRLTVSPKASRIAFNESASRTESEPTFVCASAGEEG